MKSRNYLLYFWIRGRIKLSTSSLNDDINVKFVLIYSHGTSMTYSEEHEEQPLRNLTENFGLTSRSNPPGDAGSGQQLSLK